MQAKDPMVFVGLWLLIALILAQAVKLGRRILYSPLNDAKDAHWSVKVCGAWIWWQRVLENDAQAVHEAHLRLGPVIRLGPSEISVNDVEGGLKPIYEQRLPKTEFYQVANSYGEEPMVAMRNEEPHRQRKRIVAKPYRRTEMCNQEWLAERERLADEFVSGLEELVSMNSTPELYDVFFAWSVTSISTYIFGRSGRLNLLHDIPEARRLREGYFSQRAYQFVQAVLPIPSRFFDWMGYQPEIRWIWQMQDRAEKAQSYGPKPTGWTTVYDSMKQSLVSRNGKQGIVDTKLSAKELSILSSEMQDHIIAGIDTSAAALAACAWLLSLAENRHWQERLREEIRFSQITNVEQLPMLDAIVKETLRLYPPVAGGQPRVTDKTIVIGSFNHEITIPIGVKIHCQAQTLHRSSVFWDPDNFHPERWLDSPQETRKEMERWFWAFGSGPRRCLGEHLGLSNVKVAVAAIWGHFETLLTDRTRLTLSRGLVAMPLPSEDGDFIRLRIRMVER